MKSTTAKPEAMVRAMYRKLAHAWGPQHWWPAETPFEVIVGAILTQNTSWRNVERAIAALQSAGLLSLEGIRQVTMERLQRLIRASGYYRQKASRLKAFVSFVDARYAGSLEAMFAASSGRLRGELLAQPGIGYETADAILLYGGNHEIFVVDAYTRRILERHQAVPRDGKYDEIRALLEHALARQQPLEAKSVILRPPEKLQVHEPSAMSAGKRSRRAQVFNEMHGLLVQVGKHYCAKGEPRCRDCPLAFLLPNPLPHPPRPRSC